MGFGTIMQIKGTNFSLRPIERDDIPQLVTYGAMQSNLIRQYLGSQFAQVLEDEEEWYEKTRTDPSRLAWGIYDTQTLIGTTGFQNINDQHLHPYFKGAISGCLIFRPSYWDRDIATMCHTARTWYGLTQSVGLQRIVSGVYETNESTAHTLEGIGYVEMYRERNVMFSKGELSGRIALELVSPYDHTWSSWWHGDNVPTRYKEARGKTLEALEWAEENIELP